MRWSSLEEAAFARLSRVPHRWCDRRLKSIGTQERSVFWIPVGDLSYLSESHWDIQSFDHHSWTYHCRPCGWILHIRYQVLFHWSAWLDHEGARMHSHSRVNAHQSHRSEHHTIESEWLNPFSERSSLENPPRWIKYSHCYSLVESRLTQLEARRKSREVTSFGIRPWRSKSCPIYCEEETLVMLLSHFYLLGHAHQTYIHLFSEFLILIVE